MKIRDFIDLEASQELLVFLKGTKKITPRMKYDAFVKNSLEAVNPVVRDYIEAQKPKMLECKTVEEISNLNIPVLTPEIKELIVSLVEKQKHLDLVEQTYLLLDLWRAVSGQIGEQIARMAMHYGKTLQAGGHIIRPTNGKIIIPGKHN